MIKLLCHIPPTKSISASTPTSQLLSASIQVQILLSISRGHISQVSKSLLTLVSQNSVVLWPGKDLAKKQSFELNFFLRLYLFVRIAACSSVKLRDLAVV